jgi:hypothetical protein
MLDLVGWLSSVLLLTLAVACGGRNPRPAAVTRSEPAPKRSTQDLCQSGDADACRVEARRLRRAGAIADARVLWMHACERGHAGSCLDLGRDSAVGMQADRGLSAAAFGAACDFGETKGCEMIGVADGRPWLRDRVTIATGMHERFRAVQSCMGSAEGTLVLDLVVGREGRLERLGADPRLDGPRIDCLRAVLGAMKFGPAMRRQTFRYPYALGRSGEQVLEPPEPAHDLLRRAIQLELRTHRRTLEPWPALPVRSTEPLVDAHAP